MYIYVILGIKHIISAYFIYTSSRPLMVSSMVYIKILIKKKSNFYV